MIDTIYLDIKNEHEAITQVPLYIDCTLEDIQARTHSYHKVIYLIDEQVLHYHTMPFPDWDIIAVKSGEDAKDISYCMHLMQTLLQRKVDKKSLIIGVGGGVVTDIVGFLGATYMRGIDVAFVPTTILAMVDASIGGKNGVNIGNYKNMMGTILQPRFIAYHFDFLSSLPQEEWVNGFAEIIKHACIRSTAIWQQLVANNLTDFRTNKELLVPLIKDNIAVKASIVAEDVSEKGLRKMLNFGHTIAHIIEKNFQLSHGQAVSIGMYYDVLLSEQLAGFRQAANVVSLLQKYHLPTQLELDFSDYLDMILVDKKVANDTIDYILLREIGQGIIQPLLLSELVLMIKNSNK